MKLQLKIINIADNYAKLKKIVEKKQLFVIFFQISVDNDTEDDYYCGIVI